MKAQFVMNILAMLENEIKLEEYTIDLRDTTFDTSGFKIETTNKKIIFIYNAQEFTDETP